MLKQAKCIEKFLISIILSVSLLLLSSCSCLPFGDAYLQINGKVFEWTNAPDYATSKIYIKDVIGYKEIEIALKDILQNIPEEIAKKPLEGAIIEVKKRGYRLLQVTSNASGDFEGLASVFPSKQILSIIATKTGYFETSGNIQTENISIVIVTILVKNK